MVIETIDLMLLRLQLHYFISTSADHIRHSVSALYCSACGWFF